MIPFSKSRSNFLLGCHKAFDFLDVLTLFNIDDYYSQKFQSVEVNFAQSYFYYFTPVYYDVEYFKYIYSKTIVLNYVNVYVNLMEAVKTVVQGFVTMYVRLGDTTFSVNTF